MLLSHTCNTGCVCVTMLLSHTCNTGCVCVTMLLSHTCNTGMCVSPCFYHTHATQVCVCHHAFITHMQHRYVCVTMLLSHTCNTGCVCVTMLLSHTCNTGMCVSPCFYHTHVTQVCVCYHAFITHSNTGMCVSPCFYHTHVIQVPKVVPVGKPCGTIDIDLWIISFQSGKFIITNFWVSIGTT